MAPKKCSASKTSSWDRFENRVGLIYSNKTLLIPVRNTRARAEISCTAKETVMSRHNEWEQNRLKKKRSKSKTVYACAISRRGGQLRMGVTHFYFIGGNVRHLTARKATLDVCSLLPFYQFINEDGNDERRNANVAPGWSSRLEKCLFRSEEGGGLVIYGIQQTAPPLFNQLGHCLLGKCFVLGRVSVLPCSRASPTLRGLRATQKSVMHSFLVCYLEKQGGGVRSNFALVGIT